MELDPDRLRGLRDAHLVAGRPSGWFEPAYALARTEDAGLPWVHGTPHPYLQSWLEAPVTSPPGRRALVVGCGLGDDAVAVADAGFEVTAIDVAPTAVRWAEQRASDLMDPGAPRIRFREADLLAPPAELLGAFHLVVEIHTVPWLPGVVRDAAMAAIGGFAAPGGIVLVVTLLATDHATLERTSGPPWPQAPSELASYRAGGLVRVALEHPGPEAGALIEARITWQRPHEQPPETGGPPAGGLPLVGGG